MNWQATAQQLSLGTDALSDPKHPITFERHTGPRRKDLKSYPLDLNTLDAHAQ